MRIDGMACTSQGSGAHTRTGSAGKQEDEQGHGWHDDQFHNGHINGGIARIDTSDDPSIGDTPAKYEGASVLSQGATPGRGRTEEHPMPA
jgi:hypothetical protein